MSITKEVERRSDKKFKEREIQGKIKNFAF